MCYREAGVNSGRSGYCNYLKSQALVAICTITPGKVDEQWL
ncbi:MAG: hypothetical protein M0021_11235 [Clostridia bacterium]|nr:hypothetical protein [Clostridia bacterium]